MKADRFLPDTCAWIDYRVTIPFSDVVAILARENSLTILTIDRHFEQVPGVQAIARL